MILHDESPMPFGKHAGEKMENVPASYLLWLADELGHNPEDEKRRAVRAYVDKSRAALEKEVEESHRE